MAAPATITTLDLSGKFVMVCLLYVDLLITRCIHLFTPQNKTLSNSTDKMLELQGVGWLKRKAIALATITLNINHYKDDGGVEHIDIDQILTGGIPGTTEKRSLNWTFHEHEDHVFGAIIGKSRRSKVEDIEEPFLKEGWLPDTIEHGVIESYVESDTPKSNTTWNVSQVRQPISFLS